MTHMRVRTGFASTAALALLLAGCSSTPENSAEDSTRDSTGESTVVSTQPVAKPSTKASKRSKDVPPEEAAAPVEPLVPPEAVQQFDRAVALMSSGDVAAAEQAFRSLAAAYPTFSGPPLNLGILHAKAGKLDEAEKALGDAIARNGNNAAAFNQLGIVHRRQGRFKAADEAYTRAVQIDPNYALAYLNLGVLCDLYLQDPQRALEAYERYLSLASAPDAKVTGWVSELKKRIGGDPRSARTAE